MNAVTVQEIVEALYFMDKIFGEVTGQSCSLPYSISRRIEQHGIAPPDGMVLVKDKPVCWAIAGDGKFDEIEFGKTFEMLPDSVGYWTGRGYEATPLYAAPEVKPVHNYLKQADEETHRRVDEAVRDGRIVDKRAPEVKP